MNDAAAGTRMQRFATFERILARRRNLAGARLLDFGCGAGNLVRAALARGIDAYGCDIDFSRKWTTEAELADLLSTGRVRQIEGANENESPETGEPYRLPFDDGFFDVIISDTVLEHVRNYPEMISEFSRVLKPGGLMMHIFPARFRLVEPHVFVPLASFFTPRWWLRAWAALGVRNEYQRHFTARETAEFNEGWLRKHTNYMTVAELRRLFEPAFALSFAENEFMQMSRARLVVFPWFYRAFFSRVMLGVRAAGAVRNARAVELPPAGSSASAPDFPRSARKAAR